MAKPSPEACDVLVIGAGPAGLMCACWLARRGVNVQIIDKKHERPLRGRADGLEPRTLEILNSFGLLDSWWRKANQTVELSVWVSSRIEQRILRRCNSARGTSRYYEATIDQAEIEREMEGYLAREHGVFVQYSTEPLRLEVDGCDDPAQKWPAITIVMRKRNLESADAGLRNSVESTVRAKYVVGADGSRSWTRNQVGIRMHGSRSTQYWGVADIVPLSDFPDIRNRCIIHKESVGTVMNIPRESGMVRLYVQLGNDIPVSASGQPLGPEHTIKAAQDILSPYQLDYSTIYWSSYYPVEQRLASSFSAFDRVFLLGDAIHTHSPKAGQGLNVSIQDAYNLGWKLAAVANGEADCSTLATYENDRRPVAEFLIEFDKNFQRFFHEPLAQANWSPEQYRAAVSEAVDVEHAELSGTSATFMDLHMMANLQFARQDLAAGVPLGKRIPDVGVVNQTDGRAWNLHDVLTSNGNWRLMVFCGDLRDGVLMRRYLDLGRALRAEGSPMTSFARNLKKPGGQLDVLTIHAAPRLDIDLLKLPEVFHPWRNEHGWDYDKVFTDDETYHRSHGHAYEKLGISPQQGCALLLRPDQHVSLIMDVGQAAALSTEYLSHWLKKRPIHIDSVIMARL